MKGKILNNFSLKILSIIGAIILWTVIVNIYDPSTSVTFPGVSVNLINTQSLTDKDYTYEIVDGSKISVTVTGPRSIVSELKATDIVATADLSKVTAYSDYVDIDVKVVKEGLSVAGLEITPKTTAIKLNIENRVSKTFNIQTETIGNAGEGYIVTNLHISPTTVEITGTASSINNINTIKAVYDISGVTSDIKDSANLKLYDEEGNSIYDDKIELSRTAVDFSATVLPTKTIELNFKTQGQVAEGYRFIGLEPSASQVVIAGTKENLEKINSLDLDADIIKLDNLKADKEFSVFVNSYLNPDYILASGSGKITVTAKVEPLMDKTFTIPTSAIKLVNLPEGYTVSYNVQEVQIIVLGTNDSVKAVTPDSLSPVIDARGLVEGDNTVTLNVTLPSGVTLKQSSQLQVKAVNTKTTETTAVQQE